MIFLYHNINAMKQNYFLFVCFFWIFSSNMFAQIINDGNLNIESLTSVYFEDGYTNNGIHKNNGDLYLSSNFINNDSTSAISGTTFFKSSINNIQTISGSTNKINFYNLEIDNSLLGVQVVDNFGVFVTNGVNLKAGDLRFSW